MAFTSPENVPRNELVRFDLESVIRAPGNTQEQWKRGYKFTAENRGNFFDWYNAFFEIQFTMDLKDNGGDNAANDFFEIQFTMDLKDNGGDNAINFLP